MGLLDSKKRVLDTIVTAEGRRQLARGRMNIRFATFTDQDAFYEGDNVSGSTDTRSRPHLEAFSRPQDMITFESDDVGNLLQFKGSKHDVMSGHVLVSSGSKYLNFPQVEFKRAAQLGLLTSSIDNFKSLYSIGTDDPLDDDMSFTLSQNSISFDVVDKMLASRQGIDVSTIDDIESLMQDRRLSHAPNFKYLPPKNKKTPEDQVGLLLGDYNRIDQGNVLTLSELLADLKDTQRVSVKFTETSRDSNIFGQFFDVKNDVMKKLDVIDFGEFIDNNSNSGSKHVFFVGQVYTDSRGAHTFVNLFTLIFS